MRDFSSLTIRRLAKRGITIIGTQAAPAYDGDWTNSGRVYQIAQDGCAMMRTRAQVEAMAQ